MRVQTNAVKRCISGMSGWLRSLKPFAGTFSPAQKAGIYVLELLFVLGSMWVCASEGGSLGYFDEDDKKELVQYLHTMVHVTTEASVHGGVVPQSQLYDTGMKVMPLTEGNYGMLYHLVQQDEMARIKAVMRGDAEESGYSPPVGNKVSINGQWTDATSPASSGDQWYCYTNNKYGGSAYVYIWASFHSDQQFSVSRYAGLQEGGEWNYGNRTRLAYEAFDPTTAQELMEEDGIPASLRQQLKGDVVYKIALCAFDHGYHSSSIIGSRDPAIFAIAKANLDDSAPSRAVLGSLSSN